jgi:hypothetical protein
MDSSPWRILGRGEVHLNIRGSSIVLLGEHSGHVPGITGIFDKEEDGSDVPRKQHP